MTLSELREAVLDLLDAESVGDVFRTQDAQDRAINESYKELVSKMEITAAPYFNVSPTTITLVTPSSPPREYALATSDDVDPNVTDIRKIVDVVRQYGPGTEKPRGVPIVSFSDRNARVGSPRDSTRTSNRNASRLAVYFYRSNENAWILGFVEVEPPAATTFEIRYLPQIAALSSSDTEGEPTQFPEQWHHLIAIRTAVRAKAQENRDASGLVGLYNEGLADMMQSMTSLTGPIRSQVL